MSDGTSWENSPRGSGSLATLRLLSILTVEVHKQSHQASCDQCRARTLEYCQRSCRRTTLVKIFVEIISRMTCNSQNSRKFRPTKFKRYTVLLLPQHHETHTLFNPPWFLLILAWGTTLDSLVALCSDGNHTHCSSLKYAMNIMWLLHAISLARSAYIPSEKAKCWRKSPCTLFFPPSFQLCPLLGKRGWPARLKVRSGLGSHSG